ncbi:MAG: VOC family protein [Herpetosiphon sp.]
MNTHMEQPFIPGIDPATQVATVALTVADLDRSVTFYTTALGFAVIGRAARTATLGVTGVPLIVLEEQEGARPHAVSATGLYHFAILVPTRADLGHVLRNLLDRGYPMPGQSDHLVSEALYLSDPDGNGIEVYRDRPRSEWTWIGGQVRMAIDPLDIAAILETADRDVEPWTGLRPGTRVGHIHLQVADLAVARSFYHDVLGFDVVAQMSGALFVSAGGYHHHIGLNTWHSRGAGPAPAGTAGLRSFTLELPSEAARAALVNRITAAGLHPTDVPGGVAVRDPFANTIVLHVGPVVAGADGVTATVAGKVGTV